MELPCVARALSYALMADAASSRLTHAPRFRGEKREEVRRVGREGVPARTAIWISWRI